MSMIQLRTLLIFAGSVLAAGVTIAEENENRWSENSPRSITVIVADQSVPLEEFAASELVEHIEKLTGTKPQVLKASQADSDKTAQANLVVLGRLEGNELLKRLAERQFFKPSQQEQGYALRTDKNPFDTSGKTWLAALCGTDSHGTLYAVRDFCHYHFYKDDSGVVLRKSCVELAPRIKLRGLSESGCNLFSAENDHKEFMHRARWNRFSRNVVFDKKYYVDWLSEWKINYVCILWCNARAYDEARREFAKYAHARGIQVLQLYVPYRSSHEDPPASISSVPPEVRHGDCPRDPKVRKWYFDRLVELVTSEPKIDMIQIESPYHDGIYCQCKVCQGRKNPYPEAKMLAEMVEVVRKVRPQMPIIRGMNRPVPDAEAARRLAEALRPLEAPDDWHVNTNPNRAHRLHWHDLGPKFATYLRLYRSALKSVDFPAEVDFLFNDFQMSASRDIVAHQFCYRFYGGGKQGKGSYPVERDQEMREKYPDRLGPFSLALAAEAAFDPFVSGQERARKIERIYALTIPDYPRGRTLTQAEVQATGLPAKERTFVPAPVIADPAAAPRPSKLFRSQYFIEDPAFLLAQVCADLDNDGNREIVYSSRGTKATHLLRAADGVPLWSKKFEGDHQSVMAYDLDGDGDYEILFTVSGPGRLYVLEPKTGKVLNRWDAGDWKVGNSAVVIDSDGNGVLDGYFGTRGQKLVRLNMADLTAIKERTPWGQCGCHTSAMDVDHDGHWDLFAGSGDDSGAKGTIHRYDPLTLESVWSYKSDDNASSADMVLADIDGDGQFEVVKSVDNYAKDDAHDAIYAFETDGTMLWKVDGFSGEDSPNVADLDGDGRVEIIGMTFGSEVYCLDGKGNVRWRKDLRPELDDSAHAYMTPVLCDLDGDRELEILALTNGKGKSNGILFALNAEGEILDRFDVGRPRFWGTAFVANVDDDPQMELIASGSGGLDVIETKGLGPNTEHFQRRRTYQRLNVVPWAYEDTYFIHRGKKDGVANVTDNLVLEKKDGHYRSSGTFTTELLTLPPRCSFDRVTYKIRTPRGTDIRVDVLDRSGTLVAADVKTGTSLNIRQPVRLKFLFTTADRKKAPTLDSYSLTFDRIESQES